MTTQPDPIDGILAMIADRQQALSELAASIQKCRALFGRPFSVEVSIPSAMLAEPAREASAPVRQTRKALPRRVETPVPVSRRVAPAPPVVAHGRRKRYDTAEIEARLLASLKGARGGRNVAETIKGTGLSEPTVRPVLKALLASGAVVGVGGEKRLSRIGLPELMQGIDTRPASAAPTRETPRAVPKTTRRQAETIVPWRDAIIAKLESGASYSREELVKHAQRVNPEVSGEMVVTALDALVGERLAARIPSGDTVRYQRRVAPRAKTA